MLLFLLNFFTQPFFKCAESYVKDQNVIKLIATIKCMKKVVADTVSKVDTVILLTNLS